MSMREAALAKLAKARQYAAVKADAPSAAAAPAAAAAEFPSLRLQPSAEPEQPQPVRRPSTGAASWGKSAAGTSKQVLPILGPSNDLSKAVHVRLALLMSVKVQGLASVYFVRIECILQGLASMYHLRNGCRQRPSCKRLPNSRRLSRKRS